MRWVIVGLEWVALSARSRRAAVDEARLAICGPPGVPHLTPSLVE